MSNHYHIVVHTPEGNLPRSMRHVNDVYTQRYNIKHRRDGTLFRGRYKAICLFYVVGLIITGMLYHRKHSAVSTPMSLSNYGAWQEEGIRIKPEAG